MHFRVFCKKTFFLNTEMQKKTTSTLPQHKCGYNSLQKKSQQYQQNVPLKMYLSGTHKVFYGLSKRAPSGQFLVVAQY